MVWVAQVVLVLEARRLLLRIQISAMYIEIVYEFDIGKIDSSWEKFENNFNCKPTIIIRLCHYAELKRYYGIEECLVASTFQSKIYRLNNDVLITNQDK